MSMAITGGKDVMGRFRAAIEAGRQAVAARHDPVGQPRAILAIGLDDATLAALARQRPAPSVSGSGRTILIADRLHAELISVPDLVFEHLPLLADLLVAAPPSVAAEHRLRRLILILRRWRVADCLWHGGEAEDLVRLATALSGPDRPDCLFRRDASLAPVTQRQG